MFDVVIIGLGPAGSTLARLLAGRKVLCLDKKASRPGGFKKPCGGLLAPDAQKALARFDLTLPKSVLVDPQLFSVRTLDLSTGLCRHYQRFYVNMDRDKFDRWLMSLIPSSAEVKEDARVTDITRDADGAFTVTFVQNGQTQTAHAKRVAGADGADSLVRRTFFPAHQIRSYVAVQQCFKETHKSPFYSCIFDPAQTDCYSWSVSKDGYFIFGGAYPAQDCRARFERQKQALEKYGFQFGAPVKTEACRVLRPAGWNEFCLGEKGRIFNRRGRWPYQPQQSGRHFQRAYKRAAFGAVAERGTGGGRTPPLCAGYIRPACKIVGQTAEMSVYVPAFFA